MAALRRGAGLSNEEVFRLREIVEFCFANILIALGLVPASQLLGSTESAIRVFGVGVLVYGVATGLILRRRQVPSGLPAWRSWYAIAALLNILGLAASLAAGSTGSIAAFQVVLLILLARPMAAFVFVLQKLESS